VNVLLRLLEKCWPVATYIDTALHFQTFDIMYTVPLMQKLHSWHPTCSEYATLQPPQLHYVVAELQQ